MVRSDQQEDDNGRSIRAIRGAVQVDIDCAKHIVASTKILLDRVVSENSLSRDQIISILFTMTPDLESELAPLAASEAGWSDIPMLCASEVSTRHMIPRTIRLLAHVQWAAGTREPVHVYLPGTSKDRPVIHESIAQVDPTAACVTRES